MEVGVANYCFFFKLVKKEDDLIKGDRKFKEISKELIRRRIAI